MNTIYKANMKMLKKTDKYLYDKIIEDNDKEPKRFIESFPLKDGKMGLYLKLEQGIWQFNSEYESANYARVWFRQFKKQISYQSIIVLFGLGNTQYLETILKETKETNAVLVYEPCKEIFYKVLENIDLKKVLGNRACFVVKGINDDDFEQIHASVIGMANYNYTEYLVYPGYNRLFQEEYKEYIKATKHAIELLIFNRNTDIAFEESNITNIIHNLKYLANMRDVSDLIKALPKNVPAFVIAAGPSLNKNIKELKRAKNKALLIAVDTALKPLLREGIIPDVFVTIDANKPMTLFDDDRVWDIPMCICSTSNYRILEKHRGLVFNCDAGVHFLTDVFQKVDKKGGWLETGGSVANNAFSLAEQAKMNPIIFVGQDLAYTDRKSHADGTFQDKIKEEKNFESAQYVEVEDIHGNMVMTLNNLKMYKEWFEKKIKENTDVRVIDATEGGAKIEGTEIIDLHTVIDRKCKKTYDFGKKIKKIPLFLNEDEQQVITKYIYSLPDRMNRLKRRTLKGESDYEELRELFKKKDFQSEEFKKVTRRIKRLNHDIEKNTEAALVDLYIRTVDYVVMKDIFKVDEKVEDEGDTICDNGKKVLSALRNGIIRVQPMLRQVIKEMKEKEQED